MGQPLTAPGTTPSTSFPWLALPVAGTVLTTALLWDPGATTYGVLKASILAGGALCAILTAVWAAEREARGWPLDVTSLVMLAVLSWMTLTLAWAPSVASGLTDLAPVVAAGVLCVAARVVVQRDREVTLVVLAVSVSGLGAASLALLQHWQRQPLLTGTIGNPNLLASYVAASLPATLWLGWRATGGARLGRRALSTAAACVGVAVVLLTGCRGSAAGLVVGGVVALSLAQSRRRSRVLGLALAAALGAATVAVWVASSPSADASLRGRRYLQTISLSLWSQHPVVGHGIGGFAQRFPAAQAEHLARHAAQRRYWTNARTAHCEPLHLLVELALVGGLLLLALGVSSARTLCWGRSPPDGQRRAVAATLAILAVGSLSEGSLHAPPLLTLAAVSLAMLLPSADHAVQAVQAAPAVSATRRSLWIGATLAFACSAACVNTGRQYIADHLLGQAQRAASPEARVALLRRAVRCAPNPGRERFYLGLALASQSKHREALAAFRRSALDFPNLSTWIAMGNVLLRMGRPVAAAASYRRAATLHPRYAAAYHNLGLALDRQGRHAEARVQQARAARLWPGRWLEPWRVRAIRRRLRSAGD